eukprot:5649035-Prymnesium_polylepis.1
MIRFARSRDMNQTTQWAMLHGGTRHAACAQSIAGCESSAIRSADSTHRLKSEPNTFHGSHLMSQPPCVPIRTSVLSNSVHA